MLQTEFVRVASTSEVPKGSMKMVQVRDKSVLIANVNGTYHAIGNICTHVGGLLAQGFLKDRIVTCPLHGSQFDVATGEVKRGPAHTPEPTYEVKVEGPDVLVRAK